MIFHRIYQDCHRKFVLLFHSVREVAALLKSLRLRNVLECQLSGVRFFLINDQDLDGSLEIFCSGVNSVKLPQPGGSATDWRSGISRFDHDNVFATIGR